MVATFVVSIEVELGWGTHDLDDFSHLSDDGSVERKYLNQFLEIADRYSVQVTFNVVSELFDQSDLSFDTSAYPDDWFNLEINQDGLFYGPDLLEAIDAAETDHEVCTHTYSHMLFKEMSREVASIELTQAQRTHSEWYGSETKSLVPPRHQEPDKDLLRRHGIEIVRLARPRQSTTRPGQFWELSIGLPHAHTPQIVEGVVETYVSRYPSLTVPTLPRGKLEPSIVFKPIPKEIRERVYRYGVKRALDEASENNQVVHLWCHIFDFCSERQINHIAKLLERVSRRDDVQIMTMAQLNAAVRNQ